MDTVQNNDFNSDILEPSSVTFGIYFVVDCICSYRVEQFKLFSNNCLHVLEIDHSSERNTVSGP
jgi:hypothetical protein